jgi:hypothetical protein
VPAILRAKVSVFVELHRKRQELARANDQLRSEIIERKRAQEQALRAERLAAIGQMVAGLAHESRNALQHIQSSVEMLIRRVNTFPETMIIAGIQKANERLHHLLDEVRGYAAPMKPERVPSDLRKIWQEAWEQLAPLHRDRDVLFLENTQDVDLKCFVDPFAMERVFRNILENALGACTDPVQVKVVCTDTTLDDVPAVSVRFGDNGPGLAGEQKERVFEPFFTTKTRGTGLGMAIAKRIVEAHGGQIGVHDGDASGAIIEVILPRGNP